MYAQQKIHYKNLKLLENLIPDKPYYTKNQTANKSKFFQFSFLKNNQNFKDYGKPLNSFNRLSHFLVKYLFLIKKASVFGTLTFLFSFFHITLFIYTA